MGSHEINGQCAVVQIIPNLENSRFATRLESGAFAYAVEFLELSPFQVIRRYRSLLKVRKTRGRDRPVLEEISPSTFGFIVEHSPGISQVPRQKSFEEFDGQIIMGSTNRSESEKQRVTGHVELTKCCSCFRSNR
jgi:hypothetical protein